jgi:hypothetical protein
VQQDTENGFRRMEEAKHENYTKAHSRVVQMVDSRKAKIDMGF